MMKEQHHRCTFHLFLLLLQKTGRLLLSISKMVWHLTSNPWLTLDMRIHKGNEEFVGNRFLMAGVWWEIKFAFW